jgi:APA family basic amino acid/polyamine antiporter
MSTLLPSSKLESPPTRLNRTVRFVDVVTLGLGSAIGSSIFSIVGPAAALSGPGMLLALAFATLPLCVFAVNYSFMSRVAPVSGASFEWPTRFIHPFVGFMVGWLRIISSTGAMIVMALVLVRYLSSVVPLPERPSMLGCFLLLLVLNYYGVVVAARAQTVLVVVLVTVCVIFVVVGLPHVRLAEFRELSAPNWKGIFVTMPLLIRLFFGIEAVAEIGEEVANSRIAIPAGIATSIALAASLYGLMSFVALGTLGTPRLAASDVPILDAARTFMGPWARPLVLLGVIAATVTHLNALFLIFTRYLFAMGRAGVLPHALSRVHPRWKTPHVAVVTVFAITTVGVFLPKNLVFLFIAVSVPVLLKYLCSCLSAVRVATAYAALATDLPFGAGRNAMLGWGCAGVACAFVLVVAGFEANRSAYVLLAGWAVLGCGYYLVRSLRGRALSRVVEP